MTAAPPRPGPRSSRSRPLRHRSGKGPRPASGVAVLAVVLLCSGCRDTERAQTPGDHLDRQVFLETYVDLRNAALGRPDTLITPEVRDSILRQHGVDEEDLLDFAEAHGRDVAYMTAVWDEVERLMEPLDTDLDAGSDSGNIVGRGSNVP